MQEFTAPIDGVYKLEVWGAASGKLLQGNTILNNDYGRGGYSYGYYSMNANQVIYVSVGGKGDDGQFQSRNKGGWNGGGDGEWDHNDDESMAGGGGCTSIQASLIEDGQLLNYEFVKNIDVLIVAGGAGGIGNSKGTLYYGYGGGETGSMSFADHPYESYGQQQAGQESGYTFGQGQSAPISITKNSEIPGAGGGWYGGYTVSSMVESIYAHAGGGSGHIGIMLTNGATIAGDQTFPSPNGGTETGHSGNGYCIIAWQQLP